MPNFRGYHLHLPHLHLDDGKDLRLLYSVRVVRDMVNKLSLFFLPIFLYNFGSTSSVFEFLGVNAFQRGMVLIAFYFLMQRAVMFFTAIPLGQLTNRIQHARAFILSYVLRLIFFLSMYLVTDLPWLLLVAIVFEAVQTNLFWNSYHTTLSQFTLKKNVGQDLGLLQFLLQLATVISPAIAGIVAILTGLSTLFLFGLIGTLVGLVLTLSMNFKSLDDDVSWAEFRTWLRERAFRRLSLSFAGRYVNDSVIFLWPLYVFLILGTVDRVGYLYTLSLFLAMIVTFFVSLYIDQARSKRPFFMSGGFLTLMWFVRTQVFTPWGIALVDMFDKLAANFHWLYFDMIFIRRSKGSQAFSYFIYREMIMGLTAMVFWSVFALFFIFNVGWQSLFILGAVGVMMSLLIKDKTIGET
jgi:MFS family permease